MTQTGDFIHIPDVGKLIESAGSLRTLYERRASASNKKIVPVPELHTSLHAKRLDQTTKSMAKFAEHNKIPEVSLNALNALLYEAANEYEDINQMLRDIYTRVSMYMGVELSVKKELTIKELARINEPRERAIRQNAELMDLSKVKGKEFSRKIAEVETILEARKRKLIRSLNKAFEVAGNPENLSKSDRAVVKYLNQQAWIFWISETNTYRVEDDVILSENADDSKRIFMALKDIIIRTYQEAK